MEAGLIRVVTKISTSGEKAERASDRQGDLLDMSEQQRAGRHDAALRCTCGCVASGSHVAGVDVGTATVPS
jgi:hypothetical protein